MLSFEQILGVLAGVCVFMTSPFLCCLCLCCVKYRQAVRQIENHPETIDIELAQPSTLSQRCASNPRVSSPGQDVDIKIVCDKTSSNLVLGASG